MFIMNRFISILLLALLPAMLQAQEVYKDGTRAILDLTVDMPAGAITAVKKTWTGTPSNTAGPLTNNTETGTINATVYRKLEIAPQDLNASGALSASGGTMTWVNAFTYCRNLNYNGTGWRLPTQRELQLIYIFKPALESITGTAFSATNYWSATESNASAAWCVTFVTCLTLTGSKTASLHARCVREL